MSGQSGQSLVESLALVAALAIALLVPLGDGPPIASVLLNALLGFLRAQAFVISIV